MKPVVKVIQTAKNEKQGSPIRGVDNTSPKAPLPLASGTKIL